MSSSGHQPPSSPEHRWVEQALNVFVRWVPLGGGGGAFIHFLLQQDWGMAIVMFPVTVVTGIWAAYTENFVARCREIASERGRRDVDSLGNWLNQMDRSLRWQLSGFDGTYLKRLAEDCLYSETEGLRQADDIKIPLLEEVYVSLKLSSGFSKNAAGDVVPFQMGTQNEAAQEWLAQREKEENLEIWDILAQGRQDPRYRSIAIQAWGGFGKTTLMKHLAFTYARNPGKLRRRKVPRLIPALLYLRKWKDLLAQETPPTLPDLLEQHYLPGLAGAKPLTSPEGWAQNLLQNGKMLILFDGFDEVAEAQRPQISEWISQQIKNYSLSTFILTSRPGGYKQYTAEKPKTNLLVNPFNEEQRADFVKRWYACQERQGRSQSRQNVAAVEALAMKKAEDLLQQIEQREELRAMATNPLLLNMIATFHRFYPGSELPRKRAELYQEICRLQLGDRPRARRIDMLLPAESSQKVLQGVALTMVQRNLQIIPYDELQALVQEYLTPIDAAVSAEALIQKIVRVSELLVEREPGEYQFAHLSLQEYLAAAQIKALNQEHLLVENNEAWRGTSLLYAAQVTPTSLVESLCQIGTSKVLTLAYDCWFENPSKVPQQTFQKLQECCYQALESHLRNGERREADEYTYQLMVQVCKKESGDWLWIDDFRNFPCEDLKRIDGLWLQYSDGCFGFSVQKQIWIEVVGKLDFGKDGRAASEAFQKFSDRVGWQEDGKWVGVKYSSIKEVKECKLGHLPYFPNDRSRIAVCSFITHRDL